MKLLPPTLALGVVVLLAACGQKTEANSAAPTNAAKAPAAMNSMGSNMSAMSGSMANMAATKTGKGTGIVKAIDKAAGSVTLDHGPIPAVNWPAMTMTFKAAPALLEAVKVGDKVAFDMKLQGEVGEVTAISKQ